MRGRRFRRIATTVLTATGLVVILALASGEVRLVTTHGVSMLPRFHTGDLAVIVPAGTYHVGDIVGYQSPLLHITVLHRIVAEHGGLFTFKGDNNSFLDPVHLPPSAVKGRLWLHVPHAGAVLGWVRSPFVLGFLAFVIVALGIAGGVSRRQRASATRPVGSGPKHTAGGTVSTPWWRIALPVVLAVTWLVFGAMAWSRPITRPSLRPVTYAQRVAFAYSATAPAGTTYPNGSLSTGDPVFLRLVRTLDVTARYAFTDTTPHAAPGATGAREEGTAGPVVSGTIGAVAMLKGPGGWSGQIAQVGPSPFTGTAAEVDLPIDLSRIATLEKAFAAETGVPVGSTDMVVVPTVHVRGTLERAAVSDSFAPPLAFQVSGLELGLAAPAPAGAPGSSGAAGAGSGTTGSSGGSGPGSSAELDPSISGTIALPSAVPAHLTVLGRTLSVGTARMVALVGLALSALAVIAGWTSLARRRRMDDTELIHAAYGDDMVAVTASPATAARLVVDVESFAALARLARRYDCLILELGHESGHAYYVECGATIYRFDPEPEADEQEPAVSDVPAPPDLTYFVSPLPSAS